MKRFAISIGMMVGLGGGAALMTPAQAYIGEGIQGRPHGGNAAERFYAYRHGVPYTGPRRRHRQYGSPYRSYHYGY